jgi:hypothetical protein
MAFQFDKTAEQYLQIAEAIITGSPCTITFLQYRNAQLTDAEAGVSIHNTSGTFNAFRLHGGGAGIGYVLQHSTFNPGVSAINSTSGTPFAEWYHAAVTRGSVGGLYLNNVMSTLNTSVSFNATETFIGARRSTTFTVEAYANGFMAEVGIYNATLSIAEINSLYKGFKPYRVRPQSLIFYSPLVRNLNDLKASRVITNNNTATAAVHPRVY